MSDKIVTLLWTGGWDSTYRLVELSRTDSTVQPVYLTGDGRISKEYELMAMEKILSLLSEKKETIANIKPIKIVDIKTLPENMEIKEAYNRLRSQNYIGTQYEFIAKYALENPGVELCAEKPDDVYCGFDIICESNGGYISCGDNNWCLNNEKASDDCKAIFGNLLFPIIDKTESDMKEEIKRLGVYDDVMSSIWFCHLPIDGKPCGMCNPCVQKIEKGMNEFFPESALKRYKIASFTGKHFGEFAAKAVRKILRTI